MIKTTTKIFLKMMIGLIFALILVVGVLAWKVTEGAIPVNRAIPWIEEQFQAATGDETIEITDLTLEWQGWQNPLGLSAKNIIVSNPRGPYLYAPEIDIDVSIRSLMVGELRFETIWIRQIALSLTKAENGEISLTGRGIDDEDLSDMDTAPAILRVEDVIQDLPNVDILRIDEARVIYRDDALQTISRFDPVTVFIERQEDRLGGFLTFPFGEGTQDNTIRLNFITENDPTMVRVTGAFRKTPIDNFLKFMPPLPQGWDLNMVADADVSLMLDNGWQPHQLNAEITAARGQIFYPFNEGEDHWDVSNFKAHLSQNTKEDMLQIEALSMRVNDQTDLNIAGSLTNLTQPSELLGTISLSVADLPQDYLRRYWPVEYGDNGAYEWLVEKTKGGVFNNLETTIVFNAAATQRSDDSPLPPQILSAKGEMQFQDLAIDYKSPLPRAEKVKGTGVLKNEELTLNVDSADIGGLITREAVLYFDDLLTKGSGLGTLTFPITAQAQNVFDFIAGDPINAFEKIDFKPIDTKGDVTATVKIEIPLIKDTEIEDVVVTVDGTVDNAEIPNAVNGLTLSGGPYEIFATTEQVKVKGAGQIQGKPITLDWHEYFSAKHTQDYISKVVATVTANDAIRRAFMNDFADYFRGDTLGTVTYIKDKNNRDSSVALDLDLAETAIIEQSLGLNKGYGQPVRATLDITLRDGDLQSIKGLKIQGNALSLREGELTFETINQDPFIKTASLRNLSFNENRLSILMAEQEGLLKTNITGSFLDARPLLGGKKEEVTPSDQSGRAREIGINVLEMRTSDTQTIKNAKAYIRLDKAGTAERFEMDAQLGEGGQASDLYVRYTPDVADGLTLRVESDNAGETLRAFDLYPYIQGGELQIAGVPMEGGRFGDVRGQARINDFSVANAPILLRLVNALSFQNFLQADGLSFSRLEADFEWQQGDQGDLYTIQDGKTSGASVALTFDGYVDTAKDEMNIKGTAAPLSEINNIVGKIPLIGQILTGGEALLAATYTITGNSDDPSVGVNPLSILTPGIIRKMVFENTPEPENLPTPAPDDRPEFN